MTDKKIEQVLQKVLSERAKEAELAQWRRVKTALKSLSKWFLLSGAGIAVLLVGKWLAHVFGLP